MEVKWAVAVMIGILLAVLCILLAVLCIWLAAVFIKWLCSLDWTFESARERAGRHGEKIASEIICRVLREGDYLLTNIEITYDGKPAEMDCIIVNKFGVFRQLKRQVYLLAHYLQHHRIKVWVEGYVILLHQNSPVDSGYIISSPSDIDRAIHTKGKNHLHPKEIEQIIALLQRDVGQS